MALKHFFSLCLIVISYQVSQGNIDLKQRPTNTAGKVGEPTEVNCTVNLGSKAVLTWSATFLGKPSAVALYTGSDSGDGNGDTGYFQGEWGKEFEADEENRHNIIIKSTSNDMAGKYECKVIDLSDGQQYHQDIQLASLGELSCPLSEEDRTEGDVLVFDCSVQISSDPSLRPVLTWYVDGEEVDGYSEIVPTSGPLPEPVTISWKYNFTVDYTHSGVPFVCELAFKNGSNVEPTPPTYTDRCETSFGVIFTPRNVTTDPVPVREDPQHPGVMHLGTLDQGEFITCNALGNPQVTYKWNEILPGQTVKEGQKLEMTEDMAGSTKHVWNCTASNKIQGQTFSDFISVSFYVDVTSSASSLSTFLGGILFMALLTSIFGH